MPNKRTGIAIKKGKKGVVCKMNVLGHARGSEEAGTTPLAPGSPGDKDKESESWDTKVGTEAK